MAKAADGDGAAEVKRVPTVRELQAFLPPPSLEDRLRALAVAWYGRAKTYKEDAASLLAAGDSDNRVTALARGDCWLRAVQDLKRLLDQYEKEQVDGQAAAGE